MLNTVNNIILKLTLPERFAGESVLTMNTCSLSFLCEHHTVNIKFINRIIRNVRLNNVQKKFVNEVLKNALQQFKYKRKLVNK